MTKLEEFWECFPYRREEFATDQRDAEVSKAEAYALCAEIERLRGVLSVIAGYGDEDNEWDAVERYEAVRNMAGKAVTPPPPDSRTDSGVVVQNTTHR